jgi:hypothetical protein
MHAESLQRHQEQRAALIALTDEARADADRIRREAREMLERARAEVDALARRRSDITSQLGALSGVIDALAVPNRPAGQGPAVDGEPTRGDPDRRDGVDRDDTHDDHASDPDHQDHETD